MESSKKRSQKGMRIFDAIWSNALVVILAIIWMIPVFYVVISSFSAQTTYVLPDQLLPTAYTFDNYVRLFTTSNFQLNFGYWYLWTLVLAVLNTVLTTSITVLTAYVLSRFRFKGRKLLMNISLILGMFPGFMAMIAVYLILSLLGLINSIWSLLLYYVCGAGMGFFVTKGYFDTISNDIDEAAKLDGASRARIFFQIYLPLAKPIIIYTALMAFMGPWADYILAGLVLRDVNSMTVAVGLYNLMTPNNINDYFTVFCAGAVVVAVPIVGIYISLQRFFVAGISAGAVKG